MFKASKDPQVMNLQVFRYSELLVKLNKSVADKLNQPASFPGKFFSQIAVAKTKNAVKPKTQDCQVGLFRKKNWFSEPWS